MSGKKIMTILSVCIFLSLTLCSFPLAKENNPFNPGKDSGFYYTVKKGDTLAGLSEKFYNSQWDWPGLWEMNKKIKNPHWIYPGETIQIFLKEEPFLPDNEKPAKKTAPEKETASAGIETFFSFSNMDHVGFIKDKPVPFLGSVIKEQDDNLMMAANDIVYIKPSGNGTLVAGRSYHIFSTSPVEKKTGQNRFKGIKHLIKAQIKIVAHNNNYAIGTITHSYRPVNKDDLIMAYYKRDSVLRVEKRPEPINARLICSEDNHLMVNDHTIAFIDAGSASVQPGQIYDILRKNDIKENKTWSLKDKHTIALENLKSGKLIVLHTEKTASTVMILSSQYPVFPGDIIN